jgi:hypothetical protein
VSHGVGLGAVSVGPFVTPRARIGSTEATGQLSVSFGKLGVSGAIRANGTRPRSFASAMGVFVADRGESNE